MTILIIYATNSGGTLVVAQSISDLLTQKGHTLTVKEAAEVNPQELTGFDLIILASCTWDYAGEEGMPHEHFMNLSKQMEGQTLENKPFAIVGLGDSSYTHFCTSVDHLEAFVGKLKGKLLIESLRIDGFYFNQEENNKLVQSWTEKLAAAI